MYCKLKSVSVKKETWSGGNSCLCSYSRFKKTILLILKLSMSIILLFNEMLYVITICFSKTIKILYVICKTFTFRQIGGVPALPALQLYLFFEVSKHRMPGTTIFLQWCFIALYLL